MTQAQLAAVISRTGKYLSEVETGRARLTEPELEKLATALGVTVETIVDADPDDLDQQVGMLPQRIRDAQRTGPVVLGFQQLIDYVERSGWLRQSRVWNLSSGPFPEEQDIARVEQLADLTDSRAIQLCYVFPKKRLPPGSDGAPGPVQGSSACLPAPLFHALRWAERLREGMDRQPDLVRGYALDESFPYFSPLQSYVWVETAEASWSEIMPLLFARAETRTHESSNASVPLWYHVPRDSGSEMVISLARWIKEIDHKPVAP